MSSAPRKQMTLHTATLAALIVLVIGWMPTTAQAQCDVPLEVQQGGVLPNVLIILDTSGSMNRIIEHPDYDPNVTWSGPFWPTGTYYIGRSGTYSPRSWSRRLPSSPTARLAASDLGFWSRYWGNYLNWIFYHATDAQRATLPQVTRIIVGKTAIASLIQQNPGLRYGLMTFKWDSGGNLQAPLGTDTSTILNIINNVYAAGWTPSAETLMDAMSYFQHDPSWIQEDCQDNFIVFVTDGYPTHDLNIPNWIGDQDGDGREPGDCASIGTIGDMDCSDYMDDVAYYMANHDMRTDLAGDQNVFTYTIGFGIDAPLLLDTAANGQGMYQTAFDFQSLAQGLGNVIGDIINRISAGAAVAVVSTEQSTTNTLFRGKFMPGLWRGWFEAYDLPYDPNSNPRWEAGEILRRRNPDSRTIYTGINNSLLPFTASNVATIDQYMTPPPSSQGTDVDLINYIRGREIPGMRDRSGWKLGDLVHSTPVVVSRPAFFYLDPGYQQFLAANSNREPVAYVGGNDGMLHAFRASDGTELWAYIPQAVLPKLYQLADPRYCHQAYVDLSPKVFDVKLGGSWKTVLVGGERTGGDSWFAIDVTDPNAPSLLWEKSVPETITSFSEPALINTRAFGPLLWTGSGPDPGGKARYAVLWMETGNLMYWDWYSSLTSGSNLASPPAAIDLDFDGYDDVLYQGDLKGDLWRWDLTGNQLVGTLLFSGDQPITARPTLTTDVDGSVLVYFGTGRYLDTPDLTDTSPQTIYCVRDQAGSSTVLTRNDLIDQTSSIQLVEGGPGWYVDLVQSPGERVTQPAVVIEQVVYVTSTAPEQAVCSAGGHSWLYALNYRNGSSSRGNPENPDDRVSDLGTGIASRPVVNLEEGSLLVQTSDARINMQSLVTKPPRIRVRAWNEVYPTAAQAQPPY